MNAVRVQNISKKYQLGLIGSSSLQETISSKFKRSSDRKDEGVFWALKDVTFDVPVGQTLGIIGNNGAGKSTLLKVISKITEPTSGRIEFRGRVASLLEVGTGFHPELTGRENIFLNGAILGMSRTEIRKKFDEIVEFSGVSRFLDTPVKRYSSGMYVRLAFSIAAHLEPEILVVDEVLSVGDVAFQKKCVGKMNEVTNSGRTVLFVSHNMSVVKTLCERCLVMSKGQIGFIGDTQEAISHYLSSGSEENSTLSIKSVAQIISDKIINVGLIRVNGSENLNTFIPCDVKKLTLELECEIEEDMSLSLDFRIFDKNLNPLAFYTPRFYTSEFQTYPKGKIHIKENVILPNLNKGEYYMNIMLMDSYSNKPQVVVENCLLLDIEGSPGVTGWIFKYNKGNGFVMLQKEEE